tara:strand:+ start:724 stop:906 length:183 start_codon:yes stop_codon:yes gene_type:complete
MYLLREPVMMSPLFDDAQLDGRARSMDREPRPMAVDDGPRAMMGRAGPWAMMMMGDSYGL